MKRLFSLLVCVLLVSPSLCAEGPDEQYVPIYQLIQEADRLNESGQTRAAVAKYVEAQEGLTRFRGIYPGWNERVINYRLDYVATKLVPLSSALAARAPVPTNATASALPPTNLSTATPPAAVATSMPTEFANQIKSLQAEIERLQADNRLLGAKLKEALSVQPAALDPREMARAEERIRGLQKENELYKTQLAQKTSASAPSAATAPPEVSARLTEQNELITTLRTENEVLKKQTSEWRQKYDAAVTAANAAKPEATPPATEQDTAVRQLAADNKTLQKQVELWKEVARKSQRPPAAAPATVASMPPSETRSALEALRARLQVLEAKPVPYTAEELALFEKPSAALAANVTTSPGSPFSPGNVLPAEGPMRKVGRGVPLGATELVRAAERAFGARNYAEAEQKYLEIVRQDESNVTMVGNLASAQLEQRHLAEAEKNVKRALELDPDDYFALYLLGRIRFNQEKLDEAFEALSRSARTNPNYADAQNYLGIVLSEKGQRAPAEAALRRAVQLQPDNAVAHNNLAVVYATQKPPALALARWHYQKALAAGHPRNAELEKLLGKQP